MPARAFAGVASSLSTRWAAAGAAAAARRAGPASSLRLSEGDRARLFRVRVEGSPTDVGGEGKGPTPVRVEAEDVLHVVEDVVGQRPTQGQGATGVVVQR